MQICRMVGPVLTREGTKALQRFAGEFQTVNASLAQTSLHWITVLYSGFLFLQLSIEETM